MSPLGQSVQFPRRLFHTVARLESVSRDPVAVVVLGQQRFTFLCGARGVRIARQGKGESMAKRDGEGIRGRQRECAGEIRVSSVSSVRCPLSFSSGRRAVKVDSTTRATHVAGAHVASVVSGQPCGQMPNGKKPEESLVVYDALTDTWGRERKGREYGRSI